MNSSQKYEMRLARRIKRLRRKDGRYHVVKRVFGIEKIVVSFDIWYESMIFARRGNERIFRWPNDQLYVIDSLAGFRDKEEKDEVNWLKEGF